MHTTEKLAYVMKSTTALYSTRTNIPTNFQTDATQFKLKLGHMKICKSKILPKIYLHYPHVF